MSEQINNPILTMIYEQSDGSMDNVGSRTEEMVVKLHEHQDKIQTSEAVTFFNLLYDDIAEEYSNGDLSESDLNMLASRIAKLNFSFDSKTDIVNSIRDKSSKNQKKTASQPINIWVQNNIDKVNRLQSTDTNVDTKYQFVLKDYDKSIESEGFHRDFNSFREKIFDITLETVSNPDFPDTSEYENDEWHKFIDDFIKNSIQNGDGKSKFYEGNRTSTINEIKDRVTRAFDDLGTALERNGSYYDEEAGEIYIPNDLIRSIIEDKGLTTVAIQKELDAKGVIDGSVSKQVSVDGTRGRFWVLPEDFCDFEVQSIDDEQNPALDRVTTELG